MGICCIHFTLKRAGGDIRNTQNFRPVAVARRAVSVSVLVLTPQNPPSSTEFLLALIKQSRANLG